MPLGSMHGLQACLYKAKASSTSQMGTDAGSHQHIKQHSLWQLALPLAPQDTFFPRLRHQALPYQPAAIPSSCPCHWFSILPGLSLNTRPSSPALRGGEAARCFPQHRSQPCIHPLFPWPDVLRARSFADAVHGSSFSSDTSLLAPLASQKAGHGPADHTSLPWKFFPGARLTQRDKSSLHVFNHCSALDILECFLLSGRPFHSLLGLLSHSPLAKQQSDARRHKGQSKPEMWHFTRG